jgi:hypothetical protein
MHGYDQIVWNEHVVTRRWFRERILVGATLDQVVGAATLLRSARGLLVGGVRWDRLNSGVPYSITTVLRILRRKSCGK